MSDPAMKRRRWRNALVAIVLAIVGGGVAWIFRPLTETERALIGTWSAPWGEITFQANRRYRLTEGVPATGPASGGSWSAGSNRLSICPDVNTPLQWNTLLFHARVFLSSAERTGTGTLTFAGPDSLESLPDGPDAKPETWDRDREQNNERPPVR